MNYIFCDICHRYWLDVFFANHKNYHKYMCKNRLEKDDY